MADWARTAKSVGGAEQGEVGECDLDEQMSRLTVCE